MKEYRVTPLLAEELSFITKSEVSGFSFMMPSKTVVTCSCGNLETFPSSVHTTCSKCGKKLIQFHNAPSRPNYRQYERCYCERDGDEVTAYRLIETLSYDGDKDEYVGTAFKNKLFVVNCKTLDLETFQKAEISVGAQEASKIPELKPFMLASIVATDGHLDNDSTISRAFEFFRECHWTGEEIEANPFFYSLLLKYHLIGILLPFPSVEKLLCDGLHITTPKMQQVIMNNPTALCQVGQSFVCGKPITTFYGMSTEIKKTLSAFVALEKDEFPHSEFYIDMIDRGVLNLMRFCEVMENYTSIKEHGTMEVEEQLKWFSTKKTVKVPSKLADVYAEFVHKFYNRNIDIIKEFYERTTKLQAAGIPLILENYLDKEYFNIANSGNYLYSGSDFKEEFQKDPLQCLKKMK